MIGLQGVALASHGYLLIAVCFRTLDASWEEQSYIAGRRLWGTMVRVTLPILKPALLAAALFFAVVAMETFDIPVTLGMTSRVHVISTQIYWSTRPETGQFPDYGLASALSVLLVLIALVLIHFYQRQTRNAKRFVTITGRGYRPGPRCPRQVALPLFLGVDFRSARGRGAAVHAAVAQSAAILPVSVGRGAKLISTSMPIARYQRYGRTGGAREHQLSRARIGGCDLRPGGGGRLAGRARVGQRACGAAA